MQGEKDWEKYEVARKLKSCVDNIRDQYRSDLKSRQMSTRQRAVALYFIDKVWYKWDKISWSVTEYKVPKMKHFINEFWSEILRKEQVEINSVSIWFLDILKLALRAGNEKEEGETADTVGCCSLRVEHITLHEQMDGKEYVVEFDFLGKDSIRYYNKVPVIKKVKLLEMNYSNSFQSNQISLY